VTIVSCVLTKSIAFDERHVEWLGRQVAAYCSDAQFVPFSNVPLSIPHERLERGLPSWWAKMEALARLPDGSVLMLDLDTVIIRPWTAPPVPAGYAYMQSAPNIRDHFWGGMQLSSPEFRATLAAHFDPRHVDEAEGCDQKYYRQHWLSRLKPMQFVRPDEFVSFKLHVEQHGLRPQNTFVMFHGLPRPWNVSRPWIPPLEPA
jgi:hypothetical protein